MRVNNLNSVFDRIKAESTRGPKGLWPRDFRLDGSGIACASGTCVYKERKTEEKQEREGNENSMCTRIALQAHLVAHSSQDTAILAI